MAARFAEPQGGGLSMVQGGAVGLPPLFAETLLGSPLKAEFPAGASAKRAAIPAPNLNVLPKTMVQSEPGGQGAGFRIGSNFPCGSLTLTRALF
jgi:hypothetical protein